MVYYRHELFQGLLVSWLGSKSLHGRVFFGMSALMRALQNLYYIAAFMHFVVLCSQCRRILGVCIRSVLVCVIRNRWWHIWLCLGLVCGGRLLETWRRALLFN